ncbi:uncharacterized protein TrAtP1_007301 [Trichoderma atroviride]|uniref:Uncharacterized protein n=1 Tax=Hypocrea atroviridis (strain ATCC 20476 / IMI 206040) TaxID=452589 RepID=G9NG20_HYPAI|nr:uncharacterized protein TRIATDRAFT_90566 [Trichoderma atroviride IMI 206040]EHK50232.1 hypothetical protein TRIATDRAFT_90566 [Trichoderma atroviride IMI 206040]UKZ66119.1 hypothetical protein TrAtP1_007301 [Trichoderma atroviride]
MNDNDRDKLGRFFAVYCQFNYDPQEPSATAYSRLVAFYGWKTDSKKERKARKGFQKALADQFEQLYGHDDNKLDVLQILCGKIGISPVPNTITSCKKAIQKYHVNIYDFIDSERTGEPVRKFTNLRKFQAYTEDNGKVFPKKKAKSNALLRFLLRPVF